MKKNDDNDFKDILIIIGVLSISFILIVGPTRLFGAKTPNEASTINETATIDIPEGKKLIPYTVQWESRNSSIFYLLDDTEPDYNPKTYTLQVSSKSGTIERTVKFIEH